VSRARLNVLRESCWQEKHIQRLHSDRSSLGNSASLIIGILFHSALTAVVHVSRAALHMHAIDKKQSNMSETTSSRRPKSILLSLART